MRPPLALTVLGSGTSHGVPMIGCACEVCQSADPRDNRTRASCLVAYNGTHLLIDTGPDLRQQVIRHRIMRVHAVLFTHPHADHVMGFDDLRRFSELNGGQLPIYGSAPTLDAIQRLFPYAFDAQRRFPGYVHAIPHVVTGPVDLAGLAVTPVLLPHGRLTSTGWLFEREGERCLAYLTDCHEVPAAAVEQCRGVRVLVIDGLRDEPHPTHLTIEAAIEAGRRIEASRIIITHLTHHRSHQARLRQMPEGVEPAYDGLTISI